MKKNNKGKKFQKFKLKNIATELLKSIALLHVLVSNKEIKWTIRKTIFTLPCRKLLLYTAINDLKDPPNWSKL